MCPGPAFYLTPPSIGACAARLRVVVDQRGIDVAVEVLRPDGSTLIAVDSPTDKHLSSSSPEMDSFETLPYHPVE